MFIVLCEIRISRTNVSSCLLITFFEDIICGYRITGLEGTLRGLLVQSPAFIQGMEELDWLTEEIT